VQYQPLSTAAGPELAPRAGDADATIHVPTSAAFYQAAIEGLSMLDEQILELSPDFPRLYEADVVYRKEKRDTWRHADDVLCSGWGDCEDLAAWRVAELRVSGEDPDAYVYVYQSGPHRFHAVVARGSGRIEDPSLILGMQVSAERRSQMPKYVGQGEGYSNNTRPFGTCPRAAAMGAHDQNLLETGESIGDASAPFIGARAQPEHHCNPRCPHFAEQWKQAVRGAISGEGIGWGWGSLNPVHWAKKAVSTATRIAETPIHMATSAVSRPFSWGSRALSEVNPSRFLPSGGGSQAQSYAPPPAESPYVDDQSAEGFGDESGDDGDDYVDDGSQDYQADDGSQQPQYDQQQVDQGPRGPSRGQKVGRFFSSAASAAFQPVKWAGNLAYQPVRLASQALRTTGDVAKGAVNLATKPLKWASKLFSIFGVEGMDEVSPNMLGVEEDEEYEEGDEEILVRDDIFSSPNMEYADDEDLEATAAIAPPSQRMRFETAQVEPGVWGGRVMIPRIDEPGKAFTMYTSPAASEREAAERMANLARQAAHNPGLQMVVAPSALITLAAMRMSQPGKLRDTLQSIGRFVRFEG
jgi:hypothetical protein